MPYTNPDFLCEPHYDSLGNLLVKAVCRHCGATRIGNADEIRPWQADHDCPARDMRKRILQIAFDNGLMVTRELLLTTRNYQVVSVLGIEEAKNVLARDRQFDIVLVGHLAPAELRHDLARWLKKVVPAAKVVALNPPLNELAAADYNIPLNGPDEWLGTVASIFAARQQRAGS